MERACPHFPPDVPPDKLWSVHRRPDASNCERVSEEDEEFLARPTEAKARCYRRCHAKRDLIVQVLAFVCWTQPGALWCGSLAPLWLGPPQINIVNPSAARASQLAALERGPEQRKGVLPQHSSSYATMGRVGKVGSNKRNPQFGTTSANTG